MRDHIQARNMSDTFVIRYCLFHLRKVFTSIVSGPSSIEEIEKITHSKIYSCYQPQYCKFITENKLIPRHYILHHSQYITTAKSQFMLGHSTSQMTMVMSNGLVPFMKLKKYCTDNQMALNESKTVKIVFTTKNLKHKSHPIMES